MNHTRISLADSDEDVMEVGIGNNGPWSSNNESIYVDLMDEDVKNYNRLGWCPIKGTADATDEVWNMLYKINSKAKSFRKSGFPHYAAMTRVLGDNIIKGMNAFVDNFKAGVKERGKAITPRAMKNLRKRDSYSSNLSASLNVLAESSRKKVELLEIWEKARVANGLSYLKAMTKLKEDPTWRTIFLGIPDKRKMDWCTSLP
ncbi:hypothetical protein Acr_00g0041280 [Actinidia rufa]|uniref:Uncharacterized protein n=1 Tax=Actinidia rufa TaxID=165716 RepID=A0A7J0DIE9_9ERIC|nr:hypothetical protein Acr_00g0041280 [Actinidia rufa]